MPNSLALPGIPGALRLFWSDLGSRLFWLTRIMELTADWVYLVALTVIVYRVSGDVSVVGLFLIARVAPRAALTIAGPVSGFLERSAAAVGLGALRAPLIASLLLVDDSDSLWWAAAVVLLTGFAGAIADRGYERALVNRTPRMQLGAANGLNVLCERFSLLFGPLLCAALIAGWGSDAAVIVAASLTALAALARVLEGAQARPDGSQETFAAGSSRAQQKHEDARDAAWALVRTRPAVLALLVGVVGIAATSIAVRITLVALVRERLAYEEASVGLFFALVGLGAVIGPPSIPRLLGRIHVRYLISGGVVAAALALSVLSWTELPVLIAGALVGLGIVTVTVDLSVVTVLRRVVPERALPAVMRMTLMSLLVGQVGAGAALALLARFTSYDRALAGIGIACVILAALSFVLGSRRQRASTAI